MALRLPRLERTREIVDALRRPALTFQLWWQKVAESIEDAVASLQSAIDRIAASESDISDAQANIAIAQTDIVAAQTDISALETGKVDKDAGPAWIDATGTAARTALASYAGQTVSNPPTQAEMQALDDAAKAISQHLVAVINDLKSNGALT